MSEQIVRQPDGRFAVFSTITDTIHIYDATAQEIVDHFAEKAAADARQKAQRLVDLVAADNARAAYFQFALTWQEALDMDREHGGEASDTLSIE